MEKEEGMGGKGTGRKGWGEEEGRDERMKEGGKERGRLK